MLSGRCIDQLMFSVTYVHVVACCIAGEKKTIFFNSCDVSKSYSLSDLNMVIVVLHYVYVCCHEHVLKMSLNFLDFWCP